VEKVPGINKRTPQKQTIKEFKLVRLMGDWWVDNRECDAS